jgi:hypothetical protein
MTLVEDDPVLKYLWLKVQRLASYENVAQSFWHHTYTHYWFNDRKYIVDYEYPPTPEEENQRKVDQVMSEFDYSRSTGYVMLFHELKRMKATAGDLAEVENQALSACESYCVDHGIDKVYAQTSIGSRARFWIYESNNWRPLDSYDPGTFAAYSEMNEDAGEEYILYMINETKTARPAYLTSSYANPAVY